MMEALAVLEVDGSERSPASRRWTGRTRPTTQPTIGELLFALVNVARILGVDPETALRARTASFRTSVEATGLSRLGDGRNTGLIAREFPGPEVVGGNFSSYRQQE